MRVWGIVLAAGAGERFGARKQFALLGGEPLVVHALRAAAASCEGVTLVLPGPVREDGWGALGASAVVAGAATRAGSVRAGLAAVPPDADIVVTHDAAHPLASGPLFRRVVGGVRDGAAAAVPVLAAVEVVKRVERGHIRASVGREGLGLAQMPMAFRTEVLRHAHAGGSVTGAIEDSALVEALHYEIAAVDGEATNVHVTTPADLRVAEALLGLVHLLPRPEHTRPPSG